MNGTDIDIFFDVNYIIADEDSELDEETVEKYNENEFLTEYSEIRKICQRNSEKELLLANALPILQVLNPEIPKDIANLLVRELLTTEADAATLQRIGNLV